MRDSTIEGQLLEAQRDALVDYYLGQVVPNDESLARNRGKLKDSDSLFEFLLIDSQVSQQVATSRVSQAISSLQQYINRIMMRLEPGLTATQDEVDNWEDNASRYPGWWANQQLGMHPDSYIDPTLRLGKTLAFDQLEATLNQGRITDDAVQNAVLEYLNKFEEVSNLSVVACYEDGIVPETDKYYVLGQTRSGPVQYYWRMLNMREKDAQSGALFPSAWTEWLAVDLPLAKATPGTVRPVFFNNRLYIAWAETEAEKREEGEEYVWLYKTKLSIAYKKFHNSWSPPTVVLEKDAKGGAGAESINEMIATVDWLGAEERLALVAFNPLNLGYAVTYACDALLKPVPGLSDDYGTRILWIFYKEQGGFDGLVQFPLIIKNGPCWIRPQGSA